MTAATAESKPAFKIKLQKFLVHPAAKSFALFLGLLPFFWLFYGAITNQLGANPAEALIRASGSWTLRFLCLALLVTPLRIIFKLPVLARFRRMLGLFVYFYVVLHLLSYSAFDKGFDISSITVDIIKRPFILVGFLAFLLLTPLALTSFNSAIKVLGAKGWQLLHKIVYGVAFLAVLHFFWMRSGKNDYFEVAIYAAIVSLLMGWRIWYKLKANPSKV